MGAGWQEESDAVKTTRGQFDEAQAATAAEVEGKGEAEAELKSHLDDSAKQDAQESKDQKRRSDIENWSELGYCTVWVGTTQERETEVERCTRRTA